MNSEYLKILPSPVAKAHGGTAGPVYLIPGGDTKPLGGIMRRVREIFVGIDRKRRAKYEDRQAIEHLQSLTDDQLRDIGIGRYEIEQRVRLGREI